MRTLAIDLGSKRVGLAMSDAAGRMASPFDVLHVAGMDQAIQPILRIVEREGVERLVIGLPLNMDGSEGRGAGEAREFGRDIGKRAGIPVEFADERLSSFAAEQILADRKRGGEKITRKGKRQRLDALAAVVFLQAFLDAQIH